WSLFSAKLGGLAVDDSHLGLRLEHGCGLGRIRWFQNVVGIERQDVFARRLTNCTIPSSGWTCIGLVDDARARPVGIFQQPQGFDLCGAIVNNHDLDVSLRLRQRRLHGFSKAGTRIPARDDNADPSHLDTPSIDMNSPTSRPEILCCMQYRAWSPGGQHTSNAVCTGTLVGNGMQRTGYGCLLQIV